MSNRDHFSPAVIREMRDRVGNRCSNPQCSRPTSGPPKDGGIGVTIMGAASHICAAMPGGSRYNAAQDDDIRHSIENGIWLCEFCAKLIDKNNGVAYPVDILTLWKESAEKSARNALERGRAIDLAPVPDLQAISYVNVPRLVDMASRRGISTTWPVIRPGEWLHSLGHETLQAMLAAEALLQGLALEAVPLEQLPHITGDASGLIVTFKRRFFTKNGPRLEDEKSGKIYPLENWPKAPHLHAKIGQRKFVMVYDPKWLTSTTAFVEVGSGQTTFAGLAVLKKGHPEDEVLLASPIVLGWPKPEIDFHEEFNKYVRGR